MTPLREWLKPPRTLLLLLFLLTLVSVSALAWFGGRLLQQERSVEAQRSQERLETAADRIAATARSALADAGERLGTWEPGAPFSGLLLWLNHDSLAAAPPVKLLYYPFASSEQEANPAVFAEAELLEFAQAQPERALNLYKIEANSAEAATRAGALLRMARVLRNSGRPEESRQMYARLASLGGVRVAGAPAELVARQELGDVVGVRSGLLAGRWHLTRGQFEYYWSQVSPHDAPPEDSVALSEVAALVWEGRQRNARVRGQETVRIGSLSYLLIWRGSPESRAILVTQPESVVGASLKQVLTGEQVLWELVDNDGRVMAGTKGPGGHAAVRTSAETQLPFTLYVTNAQAPSAAGMGAPQRFLLLGILVMVAFLILGTYFIARAIRREAETLRMQSAFVSAVSHEFRSPLTSLRQLSEILALGRVPSEDRRQIYYETMVRETSRLQRLIESLLNFGRMEAGARRYRFEELDASALVRRVASEFEPQIAGLGRRIELQGASSGCIIEADPDAICVALRNLLDNALKYSPGFPVVWVEWSVRNQHVAIAVRDQGPGIADAERKAIFRKFVRGTAAAATQANGSGVGLAMVRYIVEAHGGDITVASEPGQGSTFTMFLPLLVRA